MRPIPNLQDDAAMAARGRRSALMSCRNEACSALRDAAVRIMGHDLHEIGDELAVAEAALGRLRELRALWGEQ